ncbi:MAG: SDR family NAD(P)-dependent oxidoreductase [Verrucomicrobiota bacterium]|nr:SDR family NAD(P)-dependent oxidoreductase [Verrucomicrobiota bacterium]
MTSSSSAFSRVVFIPDVQKGPGLAIAEYLADNEWTVYVGKTFTHPPLQCLVKNSQQKIIPIDVDCAKEDSLQTAVRRILKEAGPLYALINNSSNTHMLVTHSIKKLPVEEMKRLFDYEVWNPVSAIQAILPHLKGGKVISLGRAGHFPPSQYDAIYNIAKLTLSSISFYLSELCREHHIHYSVINQTIAHAPAHQEVANLVLEILQTEEPLRSYHIPRPEHQ